jgi:hypothetical protein
MIRGKSSDDEGGVSVGLIVGIVVGVVVVVVVVVVIIVLVRRSGSKVDDGAEKKVESRPPENAKVEPQVDQSQQYQQYQQQQYYQQYGQYYQQQYQPVQQYDMQGQYADPASGVQNAGYEGNAGAVPVENSQGQELNETAQPWE